MSGRRKSPPEAPACRRQGYAKQMAHACAFGAEDSLLDPSTSLSRSSSGIVALRVTDTLKPHF
ncbi:MAG: hypothetical protein HY088_01610 [Ignavibacteriales bacterium]|nr:hypothetical protein [Ignavibacteriales bacterium]